jgi:transcription initiation factor TFIID TATA-box-binding protein|tara:strand:- start:4034 stop:4573 length:540 start_codon:yes stop_codon:yes gene_type:complete
MSNQIVNVVASTQLTESLDLYDIADILDKDYEAEQFPGLTYRVEDPKVCVLLFRSGKAVATGAKSVDDIHAAFQKVHNELTDAGFQLWDFDQDSIEIQNLVVTHNYGNTLDLSELIITMPFDKTEYEPEVFPGLIYRIDDPKSVCLVFSSGKCVITGCKSLDEAEEATEHLVEELNLLP